MNFRGPYLTLDLCLHIAVFRIQKNVSASVSFSHLKIVSVHFNERSALLGGGGGEGGVNYCSNTISVNYFSLIL